MPSGALRTTNTPVGRERVFRLRMYLGTDLFETKRQYYVYDGSSFIADFGGFMGLLLGHSVYGIVCQAARVIARLWRNKRSVKSIEHV